MAEYPYTESGSFRVRPHRPGRSLAIGLIGLALSLVAVYGAYELGRDHGASQERMSRATEARLRIQIEDLRERVGELSDERTLLERSREIDESTFVRLERQLERREQRIGHLEEELAFYRSLVSPGEEEGGLTVERLSIYPDGGNEYRYELVLTRLDHDDTEATGDVHFSIDGVQGGDQRRLDLADLHVANEAALGFRFKYFQALSGRIRLPDGFSADSLHLEVRPDDDAIGGIEQDLAWNELVSGES